jgi:hypothetical protein
MKRSIWLGVAIVLTIGIAKDGFAQLQRTIRTPDKVQEDPIALGEPLSHWLKVVRDRNTQELDMAYEAIIELGPAASAAVPDLNQIVAEPFAPIRIGRDDKREVLSKLKSIFMKGGAIDALGAIGPQAVPSASSVIEWSLTLRVLPPEDGTFSVLFIDLVAMDVLERMRGAGTIAQFGINAAPAVQRLMESPNAERRKFAVAILNESSLPIISDLMKSASCRDRMLGFDALVDMWPVVASSHLDALSEILACSEDEIKGFSSKRIPLPALD